MALFSLQVLNELAAIYRQEENAPMLISPHPGALLWPAAMIVWGPGYASSLHAHHCLQLVMALSGKLQARGGSKQKWMRCDAVLVKPDATHEIVARTSSVLIASVESDSELGAALAGLLKRDMTYFSKREVEDWRAQLGDPEALEATRVEAWIRRSLLRGRTSPRLHPRVRRVLHFLRAELADHEKLSLEGLARVAGLSPSRLAHVFTASVGVPLRPYVLWLRLQLACGELMRGVSKTEAAHYAGFSDAAHMSRTFRRMLGTTPSDLVRRRDEGRSTFVQ
jgi:AraC-like DNA-binding protein